jgi:hypothetical protein
MQTYSDALCHQLPLVRLYIFTAMPPHSASGSLLEKQLDIPGMGKHVDNINLACMLDMPSSQEKMWRWTAELFDVYAT